MPQAAGKGPSSSSSLNIVGSLDTTMIEKGVSRIKQGFERVKGVTKSFLSDQERMVQASKALASGLMRVGIIGAGAMIALAKGAPAIAPAMAQIEVSMLKLKMAAGEALAPAFEKVAVWLDKFAIWAGNHPDIFAGLTISLSAIAALKFVGATAFLTKLGGLVISPTVLTALANAAAIGGSAYLTAKMIQWIVDPLQAQNPNTGEFEADRIITPEMTAGTLASLGVTPQQLEDQQWGPTKGQGTITTQETRRGWFLNYDDITWG